MAEAGSLGDVSTVKLAFLSLNSQCSLLSTALLKTGDSAHLQAIVLGIDLFIFSIGAIHLDSPVSFRIFRAFARRRTG